MVILIAGASHTGKTQLAQRLMEICQIPYVSIDHLKMGLCRSGQTHLTPMQDEALTGYLWPILREMIKTVLENGQHLIIEGCYIPFGWKNDFTPGEQAQIRYCCLIFSAHYIQAHFDTILQYANMIERRQYPAHCKIEDLLTDNAQNLQLCKAHSLPYLLIDQCYDVAPALQQLLQDMPAIDK